MKHTNIIRKLILTTIIVLVVMAGYSQDPFYNSQQFRLYSWDNNKPTEARMRSTPGTTGPWGIMFSINDQEKMSIFPNGQVAVHGPGIGGTIRLYPAGDNESGIGLYDASGTGLPWIVSQGGWSNTGKLVFGYNGSRMLIQQDGNVGIGTTSPTHKLEIQGNVRLTDRLVFGDAAGGGSGEFIQNTRVFSGNVHGLSFFSGGLERLTINTGGGVGIGTNSPQAKFDLYGDGRLNGSYLIGSDISRFNSIPTAKKALYSLWVEKGVVAKDFAVGAPSTWADYVFATDYKLRPLHEVEAFIQARHHLPDMPSEATIKKEGYSLHDMNTRLLQKIEELTLYTIEQQKEIDALKKQVAAYEQLKQEIEEMKSILNKAKL